MKHLAILSTAGLLALAGLVSCTGEEDLKMPTTDQNPDGAMLFRSNLPNQTRDGEAPDNGLDKIHPEFGVWAVKADNEAGVKATVITDKKADNLVMFNYLVGHTPEYTAPAGQNLYGSTWFYEMLGNADGVSNKAQLDNQFLKYWDGSKKYTYFYAYSPYFTGTYATFDAANEGIALPVTISPATTEAYLVGGTRSLNSNFISANPDPNTVAIAFKHLNSQIRIAIYEDVPGYKVQMGAVKFAGEANATAGVVALPLKQTADSPAAYDYTASGEDAPKYVYSAQPIVRFSEPASAAENAVYVDLVPTVVYNEAARSGERFEFATAGMTNLVDNTYLPDAVSEPGTKAFSPTMLNVVPNNGGDFVDATLDTENCAFQFVFTFSLIAEDTGEVITIRGARVNIPKSYFAWSPNSLYTYTFRITKDTTGTTDPEDPDPDPEEPDPALYPIIFDNISVDEIDQSNWTNVWDVN